MSLLEQISRGAFDTKGVFDAYEEGKKRADDETLRALKISEARSKLSEWEEMRPMRKRQAELGLDTAETKQDISELSLEEGQAQFDEWKREAPYREESRQIQRQKDRLTFDSAKLSYTQAQRKYIAEIVPQIQDEESLAQFIQEGKQQGIDTSRYSKMPPEAAIEELNDIRESVILNVDLERELRKIQAKEPGFNFPEGAPDLLKLMMARDKYEKGSDYYNTLDAQVQKKLSDNKGAMEQIRQKLMRGEGLSDDDLKVVDLEMITNPMSAMFMGILKEQGALSGVMETFKKKAKAGSGPSIPRKLRDKAMSKGLQTEEEISEYVEGYYNWAKEKKGWDREEATRRLGGE